jgi:hypothetical protein
MASTTLNEKRIVSALRRLPKTKWRQVLKFIEALEQPKDGRRKKRWTPQELRRLPREQRNAILAEQAALMADVYRNNPELTDFEAFGEKDLYVDPPDTETL